MRLRGAGDKVRRGTGTVVIAVLVAGLAACHPAATPQAAAPSTGPACARPILPAARTAALARPGGTAIAQPGGGGTITATAAGFSQAGDGALSIGAEVGNSGTRIAYDTSLFLQAFDAGHTDVIARKIVTIPVILPGERVPVGLSATSTLDLAWANYPKVRSVRAVLVRTRWLPDTGVGEFPRVSIRQGPLPTKVGPFRRVTEVQLKGETDACTSEPATQVGIVYRDKAGAIVGGAVATTADVGGNVAVAGCVVGGFGGSVYAFGPPPARADLSRTDVALYCDPAKTVLPTSAPMD